MKKIIIAALSVLIGSFGYTIVDTALETRVAVLESEMHVVREEVSKYHQARPTHTTNPDSYNTTIKMEIPSYEPPTVGDVAPMGTTKPNDPLYIGREIVKSTTDSPSKFLIVTEENGNSKYISPSQYSSYLSALSPSESSPKESFLYLTNCSVIISDVDKKVDYRYDYNNDYSLVSHPIDRSVVYFKINASGYIDPLYIEKSNISIDPYILYGDYYGADLLPDLQLSYIEKSQINSDGTFQYIATYSAPLNSDYSGYICFGIENIKFN